MVDDPPTPEASAPASPTDAEPGVDPQLLEILVCPLTRSSLRLAGGHLVATRPEGHGLRYPIRDGLPDLLIESATLPEGIDDLDQFKQRFADDIAT